MTDDYSPRFVGDLSKPLQYTFLDHEGVAHNLTGVNASLMTFKMRAQNNPSTIIIGAGTWAIPPSTATQGFAVYTWNANDVNVSPGLYDTQAGVPFSDGFQHFEMKTIEFKASL